MKSTSSKVGVWTTGTRAPAVNVEAGKRMLTVMITIPVRSSASQKVLAKHADDLRQNVQTIVGGVLATSHPQRSVKKIADGLAPNHGTPARSAELAKLQQNTIGVTGTEHFHLVITAEAEDRGSRFAEVARDLFVHGLEKLDQDLWNEASAVVLRRAEDAYAHFTEQQETYQWSLRLPRKVYLDAALRAQEFGISHSHLACLCIASALQYAVSA